MKFPPQSKTNHLKQKQNPKPYISTYIPERNLDDIHWGGNSIVPSTDMCSLTSRINISYKENPLG